MRLRTPGNWKQRVLPVENRTIMAVYHLPKKSRNFGWNVNGMINFTPRLPERKFLGFQNSQNGMLELHLLVFTSWHNGKHPDIVGEGPAGERGWRGGGNSHIKPQGYSSEF